MFVVVGIVAVGLIFGLAKFRGNQPPLENPISNVKDVINSPKPVPDFSDTGNFVTKKELMAILEASAAATDKKIASLNQTGTAFVNPPQLVPPSNLVGMKTLYIPIGTGGSSTSGSYESIGSQEAVINSGDYPGYKDMVLEVNMRIYQGNGTAYARLFNKTDGLAINGTDVSTGSQNFGLHSSSTFTLPGGSKTYTVQLKSNSSYSADLQSVRIRVNF